jgi:hypothetical protein
MPTMTSCRKCGQIVTSTASKCPACGALTKKLSLSPGARAILFLGAAILLALIAASFLMGAKANAGDDFVNRRGGRTHE